MKLSYLVSDGTVDVEYLTDDGKTKSEKDVKVCVAFKIYDFRKWVRPNWQIMTTTNTDTEVLRRRTKARREIQFQFQRKTPLKEF